MVRVEINNLSKKFPDGTSIGPINLTLEDGEMVTLLGPSGSGKTTTLRMVAGFISPDSGSLRFNGNDVVELHPRERKIGMVVQSVALFPNMPVFQNISFALDVAGWDHEVTVSRVEELAELLGIKDLLLRRIDEISGGEAQRVALARALVLEPQLLLLDEPFSALDPQLRQHLQEEIRELQQRLGITTIYVTHSQSEAFAISDKIAILNEGVIIQTGTPNELYENPQTEFVARFIGGGSILKGKVRESKDGLLEIEIGKSSIMIEGKTQSGRQVALSIKPEDVTIIDSSQNGILASIVSITPQVGHYRILLDIQGQNIVTDVSSTIALNYSHGQEVFLEISSTGVDVIE
ncbi:MAG: ABC transporter ATP-binding protein [Candidatus Thorarchaeota archaeon]|jgi:ABC-type Fe3+/spermidine/putrescine transport system ATPase subunit